MIFVIAPAGFSLVFKWWNGNDPSLWSGVTCKIEVQIECWGMGCGPLCPVIGGRGVKKVLLNKTVYFCTSLGLFYHLMALPAWKTGRSLRTDADGRWPRGLQLLWEVVIPVIVCSFELVARFDWNPRGGLLLEWSFVIVSFTFPF